MSARVASFELSTNDLIPPQSCNPQPHPATLNLERLRKASECSDNVAVVLAALSVFIAVLQVLFTQNDFVSRDKAFEKIPQDTDSFPFRVGLHVLSFALGKLSLVLCVFRRYYYQSILHALQDRPFRAWRAKLCVEILICTVSPPAWVEGSVQISAANGDFRYSLDDVCTVLILLRVYLLFRILPRFVRWTSPSSRRICSRFEVEPGLMFAVKCELRHRPHCLIVVLLLGVTVFFGLAIRILERNFLDTRCIVDLSLLTNAMWLVIITMTTVGYGDAYPSTPGGRLVVALAAVFGMALTSLVVVALSNLSTFTPAQQRAYFAIKDQRTLEHRQRFSALVILRSFELQASLRVFTLSRAFGAALALKQSLAEAELAQKREELDKTQLLWQVEERLNEKLK